MILALPLTVCLLGYLPDSSADIKILRDTVWTSYRHLTEPVVIFPNVKLRIQGSRPSLSSPDDEPVLLHFTPRGSDHAIGFRMHQDAELLVDYAILTTHPSFDRQKNYGGDLVTFVDAESPALVQFTNVQCSNMSSCISRECCGPADLRIENSTFLNNFIALRGYGNTTVRNSIFADNHMAVGDGSNWRMEGCVFLRHYTASNAMGSLFLHSLFLDNTIGVTDPNGMDAPFLQDCLFYRNRFAVAPNCCGNDYAPIQDVTFLDNYVGIDCEAKLGLLHRVNFIKTKSVHLNYRGKSLANPGVNVYWGSSNYTKIRSKIYDAHQGSNGGVVQFRGFWTKPRHHNVFCQGFDPAIHLAPYYNTSILYELSPDRRPTIPIRSYDTNLTRQEQEWSDEKDVLDYSDDEPERKKAEAPSVLHNDSEDEIAGEDIKDTPDAQNDSDSVDPDPVAVTDETQPTQSSDSTGNSARESSSTHDGHPDYLIDEGDGAEQDADEVIPVLQNDPPPRFSSPTLDRADYTQQSHFVGYKSKTVHGQEPSANPHPADALPFGVEHKAILPIVLLSIAANVIFFWVLSLVAVVYCCNRKPKQKTDDEASLLPLSSRRIRGVRARILRRRQFGQPRSTA